MRASLRILAAVSLIVAAGLPTNAAARAAAGFRPFISARPHFSNFRAEPRHGFFRERGRFARRRGNGLDGFGDYGGYGDYGDYGDYGQTAAGDGGGAPFAGVTSVQNVSVYVPLVPAFGSSEMGSAGPRIIEIGRRPRAARHARVPVVVYGDAWQ